MPRQAVLNAALSRPDWLSAEPRNPELLWLDKNENSDPAMARLVAEVVSEVVTNHADRVVNTYPDSRALYEKLARFVGVTPHHLLLAAGSDGVIRSVFEACVGEGDIVVHTSPTFAMYPVYCLIYGARAIPLDYQSTRAGPVLQADDILQVIDRIRPKLVCLPNPDSPTGTVLSPSQIEAIIALGSQVGAWILIDEAYHPFYDETVAQFVNRFPNLIVARTFSKAWAMAGLRIGYAVASPMTATYLHKVRPMYEVNTLAVAVTERMLDHRDAMQASVLRLNAGRDGFVRAMQSLGFATLACQGNFCHVAFGAAEPSVFAALRQHVLYRRNGGGCLDGYSRFSAATPDVFTPIIGRIREVIPHR
jgi:histidinol-phosphate aminotransferase